MVNSISTDMSGMDKYSDAESEDSVPYVLTRKQMNELNFENVLNHRNEAERHAVNQRFSEMNRQISEFANLVLALTEKISSNNREGNVLNTITNGQDVRSDNFVIYVQNTSHFLLPNLCFS